VPPSVLTRGEQRHAGAERIVRRPREANAASEGEIPTVIVTATIATSDPGGVLGLINGTNVVLWVPFVVALLVIFSVLGRAWLVRRQLHQEVRQLVGAIEEIRSGRRHGAGEIDPNSQLSLVADALNRLGEEVRVRWEESRALGERRSLVVGATEESAVVGTDFDGDIREFSRGAATLFGWEPKEILSRPLAALFDEQAYRDFLPKLSRRALQARGIVTRSKLVRHDGSSFEAELTVRLLADEQQQPLGYVLLLQDATRLAQAESELAATEQRYRNLVEGLADGMLIVRRGRIESANAAFAAMCRSAQGELPGRRLRELLVTRDVLFAEERLAAVEAGREPVVEIDASLADDEGTSLADVCIKASAVEHEGRPATLLLVRDETGERRERSRARRNESRLNAVLEATSDGILVLSAPAEGGVVRMTNRAMGRLTGLDERRLLGCLEDELIEKLRGAEGIAPALADLLAASGDRASTHALRLEEPELLELEISIAPLAERNGRWPGKLLVCRDLTERRRTELSLERFAEQLQAGKAELERSMGQLEELNKELEGRHGELERLNRELRTLSEMKTNLLGNVSHELQTPLVSIRGYTEMIVKERLGPINEEQRKGLELSLKNIDRLISLIDNLLVFSRQESELGTLRPSRFALRSAVDEAVALLARQQDERGIDMVLDVDESLEVLADRDKVLQVLVNLLSNAIKFNRDNGRITVAASPGNHDRLLVRVEDSGIGIPEDKFERVFDRHYRVERPGVTRAAGSGIGLAVVRDILRLHGCRIYLESVLGEGATFSFELPLATDEAPDSN